MEGPFKIFEVTEALARKLAAGPPDDPHRHDYEELIILTAGNPVHVMDYTEDVLQTPCFLYVPMGKIHQFRGDAATRGWVIRYHNEFLPESPFHFYSRYLEYTYYPLRADECLERFNMLCRITRAEAERPAPDYAVIKQLLKTLVTMVESERRRGLNPGNHSPNSYEITFNNFLKILEENFRRPEGVQFYADKMHTSARNLNLICTTVFSKSVSEIIEMRKMTEAKQLLLYSDKTIAEIGFELGYQEKSYFTRVFRKKTGMTPSEYKAKVLGVGVAMAG